MLPEQEQRILGYFLEEATDHLNTIEQGLVNLQNTITDPEIVNEIFRAAHSIKGGAAMLGFDSIQQTAHRLEDYFKVLQECPTIQVDQKLESLFLRVFDTLQALLEQLEDSFSLPENVVNSLMSEVKPVFEALHQHLKTLVKEPIGDPIPVFQSDVMQKLREMLQLFKQADTPNSRQQLQECCQKLVLLGEQFELHGWCTLCEMAIRAIANLENTYRILAPMVIKEIKHSQELVLAGRGAEITISQQLQALSEAGDLAYNNRPNN